MNYIECINVDYKSTRKESFYGTVFMVTMDDQIIKDCFCGPYKFDTII